MTKKSILKLLAKSKQEAVAETAQKQKPAHSALRWLKWGLLILVVGFTAVCALFVLAVFPVLPPIDDLKNLTAAQSSVIYDREGNVLYTIHGEENRTNVPLGQVSQKAIEAVLAIEDDQFYQHPGVDFGGILKAVCSELRLCSQARGGSTITQQFIKNAFLSSERTYIRKLKEVMLSLQLEKKFTKDEILAMYLNRIPYGSSIYGIERAANTFFGKKAKDLTLAEGAIMAAIPKAPTFYSPYGNNLYASFNLTEEEIFRMNIKSEQEMVDINPDLINKGLIGKTYVFGGPEGEDKLKSEIQNSKSDAEESTENEEKIVWPEPRELYIKGRTDFVLSRMQELGYITKEEFVQAIKEAEKIQFKPFIEEIKAPHFVMYVRQLLEQKYSKEQIEKGGLKITTTLDPVMQKAAETAIQNQAQALKDNKASNACLVAVDPNSGQIFSMVGSLDYWNDEIGGKNNVTILSRLPGSSFKPIVYAAAYLQGYSPSTVVYDVRTRFGRLASGAWYSPKNFDGIFHGPVTMRQGLAWSLNIPAVKAAYLAGVANVLDLARKMGVQLNKPDDWYGLSLALGAGEARPLDMAMAYSIFANGGYKMDSVAILKIEDRNGNLLEEYQAPQNRSLVLDPQVAYLINNVLSDAEARPGGWWRDRLTIPGQVNAAKTGTSNIKKNGVDYPLDAWAIGYTRRIATAVWSGNNDNSPLALTADGLGTSAKIWREFMIAATKDYPREDFERPEGIKWVRISSKTGKLPSAYTPKDAVTTGIFASFSVPKEYDDAYKLVKIDKISKKLATEFTPPAAIEEKAFLEHHSILRDNVYWEEGVRRWAKENNQDEIIPTEYDDVHTAETISDAPKVAILSPAHLSAVSAPYVGVWIQTESKAGIRKAEYYWDDKLMETVGDPPFKGSLKISSKDNPKGSEHTIKVIVYDALYQSNQSSIQVKIEEDRVPPVLEFTYPADGSALEAGSSMSAQVSAQDPNGDILKVEFSLDDQPGKTVRVPPYVWQFTIPETPGEHTIGATAYDHADNKTSADIQIISRQGEAVSASVSRITEPYANASFSEGDRVLVRVVLDPATRENLKELIILAKQKGKKSIEAVRAESAEIVTEKYSLIWDSAPAGTYDLVLKTILKDGAIRFSKEVPVVIR